MKKLTTFALVLATAGMFIPVGAAEAQCNGAWVCAQVNVGVGPVFRPVVRHRARRVVVVHTQPAPPPPRVVVIHRPAPPPPAVVTIQGPPPAALAPAPQPTVTYERARTEGRIGIHGHAGAIVADGIEMGGASGALRLRPTPRYAVELGAGAYAGRDANGQERVEIPMTIDGMVFLNPRNALQAYLTAGVGVSMARTEGMNQNTASDEPRRMLHVGGQIGAGLEWRLSDNLALNADVRGFLRQRIDQNEEPEFVNPETGEETDTSAGALATIGATFYLD